MTPSWPRERWELESLQSELAGLRPPPWPAPAVPRVGAVFACGPRGGDGTAGDPGWAAAVAGADWAVVTGELGAPYAPGLLALRVGVMLERAVRALATLPDVLLVDATGRDHPRRGGLALHLGWVLDLPTIGVTARRLHDGEGALRSSGRLWVHAGWRTDAETALRVVESVSGLARTPEPLRQARRLARTARSY